MMRKKSLGVLLGFGILCQFGGCDIGQITTSTTMDGRQVLISLVRGMILTPIDAFITDSINNLFGEDDS
jgi:hypothetical protein